MNNETTTQINEIKKQFRFYMNGVTAASMRDKGANYKVNWGISLIDLKQIAKQYAQDKNLSLQLWNENARECKILSTMLMPQKTLTLQEAKAMIETLSTQELAEISAAQLFCKESFADELALFCIENNNVFANICGYSIITRLFMNEQKLNDEQTQRFLHQANKHLKTGSIILQQVIHRCLIRMEIEV